MSNLDEHIEPGDPRYDGFRIQELWCLVAVGKDDQEGLVVLSDSEAPYALQFSLPLYEPLLAADERRAHRLRKCAETLAKDRPGARLRLIHFGETSEITEFNHPD